VADHPYFTFMESNNWSEQYPSGIHELRGDPISLLREMRQILNNFDDFELLISTDIMNQIRTHAAISIQVLKEHERFN
jgi:hypothetical protein